MTRHKLFALLCVLFVLSPALLADDREVFNRALSLGKQGQWQQAADLYTQLAARNPQWPEPKNNLAVSLIQLGKITEAQQALDAAVVSRNSFSVAQNNRQKLYDYLAAQAYSKALSQKNTTTPLVLDVIYTLDLPAAVVASQPTVPQPVVSMAGNKIPDNKIASNDNTRIIESLINNWALAWSQGAVKNYLDVYSANFKPDDGKTLEQWIESRRLRLQISSNTEVSAQALRVYFDINQQQAVAEFIQSYTSSTYSDRTVKQLVLTMEASGWRILAERVINQL